MSLRVLLIDARCGTASRLCAVLRASGFEVIGALQEQDDVQKAVDRLQPDAIIIDADSPRRDTLEGMALIGRRNPRPIVMLSEEGDSALVRAAADAGISAYVVEGVSPQSVRSLVEVAVLHFRGQSVLHAELSRTQQALAERRVIDRAKCLLMEKQGLSEQASYEQLRQLAMNNGRRMIEVAESVLASLEAV